VSITKRTLKDGRTAYLARKRFPDGKRRSRQFALKRDAQAWLDAQGADISRDDWIDPAGGKVTVSEWVARFEDHYMGGLRESSKVRDLTYLRVHVVPRWGDWPMGALYKPGLQAWVTELSSKGLAPGTVRKIVQTFAKVVGTAVDARRLRRNPVAGLALPKDEKVEQRFLTPDQIVLLADSIDARYRVLILFAAYTGSVGTSV
jgi:hypothetical protein